MYRSNFSLFCFDAQHSVLANISVTSRTPVKEINFNKFSEYFLNLMCAIH